MSTHPYYPLGLVLNGYQQNTYSFDKLIGAWLAAVAVIVIASRAWLAQKGLTCTERWTAIWFIICGFIHIVFEGHFARRHHTLASDTDFLSQEWKEYAKADSRYLTSDPFVVTMEAVTAIVWGPLSFYNAWAIAHKFPSRHLWIALVSLGQIYGNVLYYGTTLIEGLPASRPEFLYFWVYFVGLNGIWMIAPIFLIIRSSQILTKAVKDIQNAKTSDKNS